MKICLISSGRSPFDERVFFKIACSLRKTYSDVTIISPHKKASSQVDGINIIGITARKGRWNRFGVWRELYKAALKHNADVYQCEEIDSWLIGYLLKRKLNCKLIFDAHECNIAAIPQGTPKMLQGLVTAIVFVLEKILVKRTDHIFTANQIVRGYYHLLNRFSSVSILYNVPVMDIFSEYGYPEEIKYDLCHEGNLNFGRGLKMIVRVLLRLRNNYPHIRILIVGDVYGEEKKWLLEQIEMHKLNDNITISGWLDYRDVGKEIDKCRIGLITMLPLPNNMLAGQPNKLFNYMRYGLAVVGPDFPEIKRIIDQEECGIIYPPGEEEELYNAISRMMTNIKERRKMGDNGRRAVIDAYNWEKMEKIVYRAYEKVGGIRENILIANESKYE